MFRDSNINLIIIKIYFFQISNGAPAHNGVVLAKGLLLNDATSL